jgi:tRNA(Ile)-lysidine synthase
VIRSCGFAASREIGSILVTTPSRQFGGPGYPIVEQALATIDRYGMIAPGDKVLACVSGGPDSTCLLDVLWRLADRKDFDIEVAHVDHGLGEGSDAIAGRVATNAAEAGFEVHVVRAPDLAGPNLHARAREFRYGFFDLVAGRIGAARIATGHTLDDRVETTLARLVHGASTAGLAGLAPVDRNRIRPLVEVRRPQTRAYCEDVGLAFEDDPANDDERFERATIRHSLVASVEERWGDGAVRAIARSSELLREDASALDELARRLYSDLASASDDGVTFQLDPLAALPRAIQRRLLDTAVGPIRDRSGGIEAALDAIADRRTGTSFDVSGGIKIALGTDDLQVSIPPAPETSGPLGSRDES